MSGVIESEHARRERQRIFGPALVENEQTVKDRQGESPIFAAVQFVACIAIIGIGLSVTACICMAILDFGGVR